MATLDLKIHDNPFIKNIYNKLLSWVIRVSETNRCSHWTVPRLCHCSEASEGRDSWCTYLFTFNLYLTNHSGVSVLEQALVPLKLLSHIGVLQICCDYSTDWNVEVKKCEGVMWHLLGVLCEHHTESSYKNKPLFMTKLTALKLKVQKQL